MRQQSSQGRPSSRGEPNGSGEFTLIEKVININRVAKVVKGGRNFSFNALVVVGDGNGQVGFGFGKAREVADAIDKGTDAAKRNMRRFPVIRSTLPHSVVGRYGAGKIVLRPASPGTGIIAGGAARAVLECLGVRDVLCKSLGSSNPVNVLRATFEGLEQLYDARMMARKKSVSVATVLHLKPRPETANA
jgi:small subunit ribosomal protein S5